MSFEEAYIEYLKFAQKRQKKQSFECLTYNFRANILSFFNEKLLVDITSIDILEWQDYILKKNFSNNHNRNLYAMLKSFFKFCHVRYQFNENIFYDVPPFKIKFEEKKTDFYTLKEFNQFIKGVDNHIYKQFFNFMFFCGTRPGEAMALKFSDLNGLYIRINKTIDEHGKREIGTPKTLSSNRYVLIDKRLYNDLLKLKKYYIEKYGDLAFDYFIFGGKKPLAPTTINRYKIKACNKMRIRPITLHQFRHSHATLLLNKGITVHEIAKRLGHSKVSTTLNVYTHSSFEQEKRVSETLNSIRFNFFECLTYNFKKIKSILKYFAIF